MPHFFNNNCLDHLAAHDSELNAVIAGSYSIMPGEIARKRLCTANGRPLFKTNKYPLHASLNRDRKIVELSLRLLVIVTVAIVFKA